MKKWFSLLTACLILLNLCACGSSTSTSASAPAVAAPTAAPAEAPAPAEAVAVPEEETTAPAEEVPADVSTATGGSSGGKASENIEMDQDIVWKWNDPQSMLYGLVVVEFINDSTSPFGQFGFEALAKNTIPEDLMTIVSTDLKDQGFDRLVYVIRHTMEYGKHYSYDGMDIYSNENWDTGSTLVAVLYEKDNTAFIGLFSDKENGITHYFDGQIEPANVDPVTDADFIYSSAETTSSDMLQELRQYGMHIQGLYYDPTQDASKEGVITTARGIHIGDSKTRVITAYGQDYVAHDSITSEEFYRIAPEGTKALLRVGAVTHIHYLTETNNCLTFCFDENDTVSWIIFSDSSVKIS